MIPEVQISGIAHVIQLAVAPVFLIAGIAGMLNVLSNRLARIVDRARRLEERLPQADASLYQKLHGDLGVLARRARWLGWAIGFCTLCALLVCLVVVVLFAGAAFDLRISAVIVALFIAAMASFTAGLILFLREIRLAIRHLRIGAAAPAGPAGK